MAGAASDPPASLARPIMLLRLAQIHRFWLTPALMMAFWRQQRIEQGAAEGGEGEGWQESMINYPLMMFGLYMAAWELPSGLIADGIGRRTSLMVSIVCYGAARGLWGLVDIAYASTASAFVEPAPAATPTAVPSTPSAARLTSIPVSCNTTWSRSAARALSPFFCSTRKRDGASRASGATSRPALRVSSVCWSSASSRCALRSA